MRDDFEITCKEIDILADLGQAIDGVYGSRMTGGGFGGCTVSLVDAGAVDEAAQTLLDRYRPRPASRPKSFVCSPSAGAGFAPL